MSTYIPKYVQNANKIIETIADQPEATWTHTQRELGELLGLSQPELSSLLKFLVEMGKVRRGSPLRGVRGKNFTIELIDKQPVEGDFRKKNIQPPAVHENDRMLAPEEEVVGAINLENLSLEHIGAAVVRTLRDSWTKEERFNQTRSEQLAKIRQYRDQLGDERQIRIRLANENSQLERKLQDKEKELTNLREQLNALLIKAQSRRSTQQGVPVREMLDDEELKMLDNLMRARPGNYRQSDQEVGLTA